MPCGVRWTVRARPGVGGRRGAREGPAADRGRNAWRFHGLGTLRGVPGESNAEAPPGSDGRPRGFGGTPGAIAPTVRPSREPGFPGRADARGRVQGDPPPRHVSPGEPPSRWADRAPPGRFPEESPPHGPRDLLHPEGAGRRQGKERPVFSPRSPWNPPRTGSPPEGTRGAGVTGVANSTRGPVPCPSSEAGLDSVHLPGRVHPRPSPPDRPTREPGHRARSRGRGVNRGDGEGVEPGNAGSSRAAPRPAPQNDLPSEVDRVR
ncbi:hypothetical protein SUDANB67_00653 [Nocardiopsis dassonvillei]